MSHSESRDDSPARKAATVAVCEWIEEYQGKHWAETWIWSRTPFPCALPNDEQLAEGLELAINGFTPALKQRWDDDEAAMDREMARIREEHERSV